MSKIERDLNKPRSKDEVLSWDETFMGIAEVVAQRSKDPSSQVGACIVSEENRILSVGYNGAPNGWSDETFPWAREAEDPVDLKYHYVIHAERNAVLNFDGIRSRLKGARVYVTHSPCFECAKELVQVGVKEVIYLNFHDLGDKTSSKATARIFDACGVSVRQLVRS